MMDSSSKYKKDNADTAEHPDDKNSLSSYASIDAVNLEQTTLCNQDSRNIDFSELIRSSTNRTVISYSAHTHNLTIQKTNDESNSLELHIAAFQNDTTKMQRLLDKLKQSGFKHLTVLLDVKDKHENTPLHLACMLGHLEIAKMLTKAGATVKIRNRQMWTPLNEAVSFGNRDLIRVTLQKFEKEVDTIVKEAKPKIVTALKQMHDFYVEIKWDFESWIPFVSRFLPSDTCKLYKRGSKLRLDCTLGDIATKNGQNQESPANSVGASISPLSWTRGDLSFLFEIENFGAKNSIIFLDNLKRTYMVIDKQQTLELDLEKEIDLLLAKEMVFIKLNTKQATFTPTQVGWFTKRDKIETLNGYLCHFFDINNLFIATKLRVEHLSDEELQRREEKEQKMKKQLTTGRLRSKSSSPKSENDETKIESQDLQGLEVLSEEIAYRPSLPPPPANQITWEEYVSASHAPCLGRQQKCKESKKEFKAQLAMSEEFPLTVAELDQLLDALVPLAKFRKLKEFINLKLPPGFPVKIDIPIVPAISAKVCFQNFKREAYDESMFRVPKNYVEELLEAP